MPEYRRAYVEGGTFFFTIVTHQRRPLFSDATNVERLRSAIRLVKQERPFEIVAGVVLPDHLHFIGTLPAGDTDYSWRIGRMKAMFTKSLRESGWADGGEEVGRAHPTSREKQCEADVWQRRFWEHTIRDERDLENHFNYIHYNPVKHGLAKCPHAWANSSFERYVEQGVYEANWFCSCGGQTIRRPYPDELDMTVGE